MSRTVVTILAPLFDRRRGWWQRPLSTSEAHIHGLLVGIDEEALRTLVARLLDSPSALEVILLDNLIVNAAKEPTFEKSQTTNQRSITGAAAERLFQKLYDISDTSFIGVLLDHRLYGKGYDFLLKNEAKPDQFIEVKGTAGLSGGVSLTPKEWSLAQSAGTRYWLVIISGVHDKHSLQIINDLAAALCPRQCFYTVIQTSWQVSAAQLADNTPPWYELYRYSLRGSHTTSRLYDAYAAGDGLHAGNRSS